MPNPEITLLKKQLNQLLSINSKNAKKAFNDFKFETDLLTEFEDNSIEITILLGKIENSLKDIVMPIISILD